MGITHVCFGLSYSLALAIELARQLWPGKSLRWLSLFFGLAGFIAHSVFLFSHQPNPASAYGSLVLLAWVLAVFYLYGSVHHHSVAWGLFVLPVVVVLVFISFAFERNTPDSAAWAPSEHAWGAIHGIFVLAASVGITVAFLASVMYLVQLQRLRRKVNPLGGLRMMSLERLEAMNRRAITLAFPMLTIGVILGAAQAPITAGGWTDAKILGTVGLWIVALLLVYLRYGVHLSPRRLAMFTLVAFGLLIVTLVASHPFAGGEAAR